LEDKDAVELTQDKNVKRGSLQVALLRIGMVSPCQPVHQGQHIPQRILGMGSMLSWTLIILSLLQVY